MRKPCLIGLKLLCLLLCVVYVFGNFAPAFAVQVKPDGIQTLTSLIRMTPKKDGPVIGQLEDGARITVLDSRGDFYKIDCYDMTAYIQKAQVSQRENEEYYVNCQPDSTETKLLTYWSPAEALRLRHSLLALAKKQIGSRYVYGSERPGAFDCSGLTSYLYKQHGIKIQRRASLQLQNGVVVPKEAMQVGDLVFFREGTSSPASHVGIYAGDGKIIHAGTTNGVGYADLDASYYEKYFLCARRVINTAGVVEQLPMARGVVTELEVNSVSGRSIS